jgi:FkbM family methyltransferase
MHLPNPVTTYFAAVAARKSLNLRGLPLIPKSLWISAPSYRTGFNQFILWIHALQLDHVQWVVDVGACHGDFSQAATAMFPDAQVLLIEPSIHLHEELARRCAERRARWHLTKCALGRTAGSALLYVDPQRQDIGSLAGFSNDYMRANPSAGPSEQMQCEVRTLDQLCEEFAIPVIDLLKVDVEGFEFEALAGAAGMLANTRAIVVELSLIRQPGAEDALERMLRLLRLSGFYIVDVLPSLYDPRATWRAVEFNILARK